MMMLVVTPNGGDSDGCDDIDDNFGGNNDCDDSNIGGDIDVNDDGSGNSDAGSRE